MAACVAVFERRQGSSAGAAYEEDSPLAIQQLALCAESRRLAVALPHGHVILFKFRKAETHTETQVHSLTQRVSSFMYEK